MISRDFLQLHVRGILTAVDGDRLVDINREGNRNRVCTRAGHITHTLFCQFLVECCQLDIRLAHHVTCANPVSTSTQR